MLNDFGQFGADAFNGEARWLEIAVSCPTGSGVFTTLDPRQALAATPYALGLRAGAEVSGAVPVGLSVQNSGSTGQAVSGIASAASGYTVGVVGRSDSSEGTGVFGLANANSGFTVGVWGRALSDNGVGVAGDTWLGGPMPAILMAVPTSTATLRPRISYSKLTIRSIPATATCTTPRSKVRI